MGASDWALVTVNEPLDTPRIGVDARRGVDMLILLENWTNAYRHYLKKSVYLNVSADRTGDIYTYADECALLRPVCVIRKCNTRRARNAS